MPRHVPPTIDSYGNTEGYLDATKDKHKGYGSEDLLKNWNWGEGKHMNITALALLFGVTWQTMQDWLKRLHKEHSKPWPRDSVAK